MANLWSANTPACFWQCDGELTDEQWRAAALKSVAAAGLPARIKDLDTLLAYTLGEEQFGPNHWALNSATRLYYSVKPILPRPLTRMLRQIYSFPAKASFNLGWPVEDRYARFLWQSMRQVLIDGGRQSVPYTQLWPGGAAFALVLTHDIETERGQSYVREVADLEESLGFRSSFNFIPERYIIDRDLIEDLKARGFEIGIHGLKHDGAMFRSYREFQEGLPKVNGYLKEFDAVGYRSPYTLRNPQWMQALEIEYDLTFFDTDPFEPIPGGVMSIWPYTIGRFVELPYTLVQDYTLTRVLGETSPEIWLKKVDFIQHYHGLALANSHPDYLREKTVRKVYTHFLEALRKRDGYWQALPREVSRWWRARTQGGLLPAGLQLSLGQVALAGEGIELC